MPFYLFVWIEEVEEHLAEHDVFPNDFEAIVQDPDSVERSRSSDRWIAFGMADDGRCLACVYELVDETTVLPVTAYEVE